MSEPVIKAKWVCDFCGPVDYAAHELDFRPPFRDAHKTRASYTHDDLVRAVAEVFQSCDVVGLNGEAVTPKDIVDRLTKGET